MARGRRLPDPEPEPPKGSNGPTLAELILAYWRFAETWYVKNGRPTGQLDLIRRSLRPVREMYGREPAAEFGPLKLMAVRQKYVDQGLSRNTVNENVARLKRLFKWAVSRELFPGTRFDDLKSVPGLAKGRCGIPEPPPVGPVAPEHVEAVLPLVRPQIRAMVQVQLLTGARPGEVCQMRPGDIDRTGPVWEYIPAEHKSEHRGRSRIVLIGPAAQQVLAPWLEGDPDRHIFRPRPVYSTAGGRRRKAVGHYTSATYGELIRNACRRAGVPCWSPNQLRHAAATKISHEFGLEVAAVILGHARLGTTLIYAAPDVAKARAIMGKVG